MVGGWIAVLAGCQVQGADAGCSLQAEPGEFGLGLRRVGSKFNLAWNKNGWGPEGMPEGRPQVQVSGPGLAWAIRFRGFWQVVAGCRLGRAVRMGFTLNVCLERNGRKGQ